MLGAEKRGGRFQRGRGGQKRRLGGSETERRRTLRQPVTQSHAELRPSSQVSAFSVSSPSSSLYTVRLPSVSSASMSLVLSLVASSSRPTLVAAVRPARRFKADKVAKPKAGTKRAGGPPVDAGDSTTETLKRVRISRLSATRECLGFE